MLKLKIYFGKIHYEMKIYCEMKIFSLWFKFAKIRKITFLWKSFVVMKIHNHDENSLLLWVILIVMKISLVKIDDSNEGFFIASPFWWTGPIGMKIYHCHENSSVGWKTIPVMKINNTKSFILIMRGCWLSYWTFLY